MSKHIAEVLWDRQDAAFTDNRYSRAHQWRFDGGAEIAASSSPHSVRVPLSDPTGVDPEEAFVAALSSCHMLWFLSIAASRGYTVDSYRDDAEGVLEKDAEGRMAITRVVLHPRMVFSGATEPDEAQIAALHHEAHENCFLAHSVKTAVTVEP